ncbi:hypothetical protein KDA_48880 [Dictyobacter alpinus]|uniref:Uncharacterized protein n=1 Tax=Dictyobacter alpinus TaxID=2014873 RepID=A0A402BDH2_9CHLR|nr:hypothetical protein KDA_48880 [Dictyobacter alpinus]
MFDLPAEIEALAWSANGAYISFADDDTTIRIWRPKQAQEIYVYHGYTGRVKNIAWAPDNIHLATASEDQTLQIRKMP